MGPPGTRTDSCTLVSLGCVLPRPYSVTCSFAKRRRDVRIADITIAAGTECITQTYRAYGIYRVQAVLHPVAVHRVDGNVNACICVDAKVASNLLNLVYKYSPLVSYPGGFGFGQIPGPSSSLF
jgi:hypothetical protein